MFFFTHEEVARLGATSFLIKKMIAAYRGKPTDCLAAEAGPANLVGFAGLLVALLCTPAMGINNKARLTILKVLFF